MLDQPFTLPCGAVLKNRLAKAALTERMSDVDYGPNEKHFQLYDTWARGEAGLMITGNIMIDKRYMESAGNVVVEDESVLPKFSQWAECGTRYGHQFWAQISHPGRQTTILINRKPVAPSAVPLKKLAMFARPRALTEAEIEDIIERFVTCADLCKRAGFTGVQIHSAHGYLLNQFLSPRTNLRTDQWGGSLENRVRLLLTVVQETRNRLGANYPIGVKLNSADFQRGGFDENDALKVINMLHGEGIDLLEISGGTYEKLAMLLFNDEKVRESTREREAYFMDFADRVRAACPIPLMVTGGFRTRAFAEEVLQKGELDVIGLGRPFLTNPEDIKSFIEGDAESLDDITIRTGVAPLEDMAEGGFHARQIELLATGRPINLNYSPWAATGYLLKHELVKAWKKRRLWS